MPQAPSPTFDRFVRQLAAEGREKADGFDHSHFDGLRAEERPVVARMLRDALATGDSTAVNGLVYLDPGAAPAVLREVLPTLPRDNGAGVEVAAKLSELAPDPSVARALVQYLDHDSSLVRLRALDAVQRMPCGPELVPALRRVVGREADRTNRSLAAKKLLACAGLASSPGAAPTEQRELLTALRSDDAEVRLLALAEIAAV